MSNDILLDLCEELGTALLNVASKHRQLTFYIGKPGPAVQEPAAGAAQVVLTAGPAAEVLPLITPAATVADLRSLAERVAEVAAPAPTATPVVAGVKVETITPDPEPVQPTQEQVEDADYPRINLISWLVSRGFSRDDLSGKSRAEINSACHEQLKAIESVAPGVKKRGRPAKVKTPDTAPATQDPKVELEKKVRALGPVAFEKLAELYDLSGDTEEVVQGLVTILETSEALDMAIEGLTDEDPDGLAAAVVIEPPTAPPVGSAPTEPEPQVEEEAVTETAAEDGAVPTVVNNGHDLVKVVAALYGYEGKLYNCLTSAKLAEFVEPVQNIYQQTAQGNDANGVAFKQHLKTMGCQGSCTACPRGAAQVAVCAAILDNNIVHEPTLKRLLEGAEDVADAPEGDLLFVKFLEGKMLVKFKPSGKALNDPEAGEAEIEAIL